MEKNTDKQQEEAAETRYRALVADRQQYLQRAHECAKLTIPSLIPHGNDQVARNANYVLDQPWQSIGSIGVNTLESKLLLTILPVNSPFFMFSMGRKEREQLTQLQGEEAQKFASKIEAGLRRMEAEIVRKIEASNLRTTLASVLKHLLVAGNCLLYIDERSKVYPLSRYVVLRDAAGNPVEIVLREVVSKRTLPPDFLDAVPVNQQRNSSAQIGRDNVEIYTVVKRVSEDKWTSWQEVFKTKLPGTYGTYDNASLPWLPLRLIVVDGEDYGRSYVEELYGDLKSAEELTKSIVQGGMIAAKLLWLVNPAGVTDVDDIVESANGDAIEGRLDDVSALQANKASDFATAERVLGGVLARLERAFLMNSSVQRAGERVTAYEIQKLTQELEDALGGNYALLAQELQLPMVRRLMAVMQRKQELPPMPKGSVEPVIITGISALGRGQDLSRLRGFLADMEVATKAQLVKPGRVNDEELIQRLANGHGVETTALIKTEEELAAEAQQQQQAAMAQEAVSKGVGPAINAMAANQQGAQ